ncbi:hypothetical protein ACFQ3N_19295 [Virgibacillus byunsanensis]|uniref:DUF4367 domain-containing protein n=1 Tax=Virgibacillus byunsanensis TaxID=570945 RepID=A0ABW3LR80_9BACI
MEKFDEEFDRDLRSMDNTIRLSENEQQLTLSRLNAKMNSSQPKKVFAYKYYLSALTALLLFIVLSSYYISESNQGATNVQPDPVVISIPELKELGLTLEQESSTLWNITNENEAIVGEVSIVSSTEYENKENKEAIFESKELTDVTYPTTFIRQHVKTDNIIQTFYFYMDVGDSYSSPYILIKLHTPLVEEDDAFKVVESFQLE